jgi:type II pantothenate kinase
MLNTRDPKQIQSLAMKGDIRNINLQIGDISTHALPGLPMDATASLFSKAQYDAPKEDLALGLIVMVLQTIGSAAILSSLNSGIKDFVLIGNLTLLPQCKEIYPMLEKLYNVHFHIPKYAEFCTAIGAALSYEQTKPQ